MIRVLTADLFVELQAIAANGVPCAKCGAYVCVKLGSSDHFDHHNNKNCGELRARVHPSLDTLEIVPKTGTIELVWFGVRVALPVASASDAQIFLDTKAEFMQHVREKAAPITELESSRLSFVFRTSGSRVGAIWPPSLQEFIDRAYQAYAGDSAVTTVPDGKPSWTSFYFNWVTTIKIDIFKLTPRDKMLLRRAIVESGSGIK